MDEVLKHGVEKLSEILRTNPDTEDTFESMAKVFEEISKYIEEQNRGPVDNFIRMSPCFSSFRYCTLKKRRTRSARAISPSWTLSAG